MMLPPIHHSTSRIGLAALGVIAAQGLVFSELSAGTLSQGAVALPEAAPSALDFITGAKLTGDFRLRDEFAGQDPLAPSDAVTLRSRVGMLTGGCAGFQGFAEYQGALAFDHYRHAAGRWKRSISNFRTL